MLEFKVKVTKDTRDGRKKPYLVRWMGEYNPHTGRQRRYCKSFSKRKDAEAFARKKENEFHLGLSRDIRIISLKDLCNKFLTVNQKEYTEGTIQLYSTTIDRLQGFFSPSTSVVTIKPEHAKQFIAKMELVNKTEGSQELSDCARNIHIRNSKRIFNVAKEWKYILSNPFDKVKLVKPATQNWHRITAEEFIALLDNTPSLEKKVFYCLMYGCGLRAGEAMSLLNNKTNVDLDAKQLHIYSRPASESLPPFILKNKVARTVPMPNFVAEYVQQLQKVADKDNPFLVLTPDRWTKVQKNWQNMWKQGNARKWQNKMYICNTLRDFKVYCRQAGIETNDRLHIHCLRKSWATNLAENGVSQKTLCELGGWVNPSVLNDYYTKATDANKDRARQILDDLMG